MPQPPAASQPVPFSTPGPSRFRILNSRQSSQIGSEDGGPQVEAHASETRPTPRSRFAPSRQPASSQSQIQTPIPAARKFRVASTSRFQFSSSSAHHRRHSLDKDLVNRGDDIEDGSSPSGTPQTPFSGQKDLLVVRESPTAIRTTKTPVLPSKQPRGRLRMEDDIEDVPASSASERGEKVDDGEEVVADSGEILMPDSVPEEKVTVTPIPQGQTSLTRQQTSAARLLSSIQPLKRRRLFVSPGLITSSPPGGKPSDNIEEGETDDKPIVLDADSEEEEKENEAPHMEPSTAFAARFQRTKSRQAWERDDDIVDNESSSDSNSDGHAVENEGIRDIVNYGELLEYGDSSESDLGHPRAGHDHDDMDDDMVDEDEDAGYDEGMMLDMTPPRVRRARLLRLQRQQQQQLNRPEPMQRLPTFQRARMFLSARKPAEEDGDMDNDTGVPIYSENDDNENLDALTTPARQRHYDALRAQPPPDFFSPQKKRRQKRKSRGRYSIDGDELASPSTAATNAPEQYVPGGLAAGLRDWLVQIKSGGEVSASTFSGRYTVDEIGSATGMSLATGRRQQKQPATDAAEDGPPARLLLAGEGRRRTQEHIVAEAVADGHPGRAKKYTVSVAHPAWEVVLGGQPWIVASDWSMQEE